MNASLIIFLSSLIVALAIAPAVRADGQTVRESETGMRDAGTETSSQVLDKRLPPVMPGQEVTINGRKSNVWSTSGEVPVSQPPEPWRKDSQNIKDELHGAEVIVDRRREANPPGRGN